VTDGEVLYNNENLLELSPEDRARKGIFLAFQYPVEIPGVSNVISNVNLLKTAVNEIRKFHNEEELDAMDFLNLIKDKMKLVELDESFLKRDLLTKDSPAARKNEMKFFRWQC